jgi:hippurate hydrolase
MTDTAPAQRLSQDLIADAVRWRQHLHQHPELAYKEHNTADFIAAHLSQFGYIVHRGLAGTGVVGTLTRGSSKRVIAIRADMDALPIQENTSAPHSSSTPGVMHACGHDGHVAIALAAARACASFLDIDGTVRFIFQPAEENEGGAKRMVDDGLFTLFPCDAIYALHNWPALPLGTCVVRDDSMLAAHGVFEIVISGRGCHGALPHEGTDTILAGCQLVAAMHTIVSRNIDPRQAAVISATQFNAGDTWNVIPDTVVIRGTTRWFDDRVGDTLEDRLTSLSNSVATAFGCRADIRYERRIPPTINNCGAARSLRAVATSAPLNLTLVDVPPSTGSEDFAFMLQVVPGCYALLGTGKAGENPRLHSSSFDFNDESLCVGAELWISLIRQSLTRA